MSLPCLQCGACCATFRVSFHWVEAPPDLDPHLVQAIGPQHLCMAGTDQRRPRCQALQGEIGGATQCSVYESRPPACREVQPGDAKCQRARAQNGLTPL
ncbi:UNVERIFIED_ORG: YkgJ family cysteine cluster protein [Shinella sp. XGS7]|nr:YkgJ family cysteine cluster protein [Shinella sp. XGS7]